MRQDAFTLLEVLIAVFLITIGMLGIFALIWQISFFTSSSFAELTAVYLLQEGFELVRNIRDSNWLADAPWDFALTDCETGCGLDYQDNIPDPGLAGTFLKFDGQFFNYDSGENTKFKRKIFISENLEQSYLEVQTEVSWLEKTKEQKISATEKLYNWR